MTALIVETIVETTVESIVWTEVCSFDDLVAERAVAALVPSGQVAVVRLHEGCVHAVENRDPFSGANVMARGIVGSRGADAVLVSPMYKQAFDLRTGACLDDPGVALGVYPVRLANGRVLVGSAG
jgi:nitrite reductase (NADH) small subunit